MVQAFPQMDPLIQELRARIRASGLRYADIEERAGFSKKYLSQLINGHVDLKVFQLFKILDAIHASPDEFFTAVARRYRKSPTTPEEQVAAVTRKLLPAVDEMIRQALADGLADEEENGRTGPDEGS